MGRQGNNSSKPAELRQVRGAANVALAVLDAQTTHNTGVGGAIGLRGR